MATLTPTITLTSTDLFPDESLNLNLTDSLEVLGPVTTKRIVLDSETGAGGPMDVNEFSMYH